MIYGRVARQGFKIFGEPKCRAGRDVNLINPTIRHRYVRYKTDLDPVRSEHRETYELGLRRVALRVRGGDDHE